MLDSKKIEKWVFHNYILNGGVCYKFQSAWSFYLTNFSYAFFYFLAYFFFFFLSSLVTFSFNTIFCHRTISSERSLQAILLSRATRRIVYSSDPVAIIASILECVIVLSYYDILETRVSTRVLTVLLIRKLFESRLRSFENARRTSENRTKIR